MCVICEQATRRVGGCNFADGSFSHIDFRDIVLHETAVDKFCTLINLCMRNCESVHMEDITILGPSASVSRGNQRCSDLPLQFIQAMAPRWTPAQCPVKVLALGGVLHRQNSSDACKVCGHSHNFSA